MFGNVFKDIYPDELELKVKHEGSSGSFLHLNIRVEEGQFVYKLYDKRDAFPFSIVCMPYLSSNIPKKIFYDALVGEFIIKRMLNQGADQKYVERYLLKMI